MHSSARRSRKTGSGCAHSPLLAGVRSGRKGRTAGTPCTQSPCRLTRYQAAARVGCAYDWKAMTSALAVQAPWWPPGSKHGYHALTFGYLLGELVRRTTGKSLGTYLREEIAGPLEIDCFIGFAAAEDSRVADIISPPPMPPEQQKNLAMIFADLESVAAKAISNPSMILKIWSAKVANSRRWRSAEIPAGNAHTNARAFATLYGALASGGGYRGVQVLTEESIRRCYTEQ